MLYLSALTQGELWLGMDLCWCRVRQGACQRADLLKIQESNQSHRSAGLWPVAGRTAESSLIWPCRWYVRAELCRQQILLLWRCIHNWTALLLHCPLETLRDTAINTQPQHLTATFPCSCCWESTSMWLHFLFKVNYIRCWHTHFATTLPFQSQVLTSWVDTWLPWWFGGFLGLSEGNWMFHSLQFAQTRNSLYKSCKS